jgi:hypothetical protein
MGLSMKSGKRACAKGRGKDVWAWQTRHSEGTTATTYGLPVLINAAQFHLANSAVTQGSYCLYEGKFKVHSCSRGSVRKIAQLNPTAGAGVADESCTVLSKS